MSAGNSALIKDLAPEGGVELFARFPPEARTYAKNLVQEWQDHLTHLERFKSTTVQGYMGNLSRLLRSSGVLPWELRRKHVVGCLKQSKGPDGMPASAQTVSSYCSAWRSFQSFMLDQDRVNQIVATFGVRPDTFLDRENGISVKRVKSNWVPSQWALTTDHIDKIEAWFIDKIREAKRNHSKALLPLLRDRVMFHLCIHFSLRISELVTLELEQFRASHHERLAHFGDFGTLTVTGKNDVTGTIPMREPLIHNLLITYLKKVRPSLLARAKLKPDAPTVVTFNDRTLLVSQLVFVTERGGLVKPNTFRDRLKQICREVMLPKKITPHTLRHTGCTLMAPIYSPEVAQRYMRHRHLPTTMHYYHSEPLNAGNHLSPIYGLTLPGDEDDFDEEGMP
ncbi:tyrosine-type recombinase/integrase [Polycyclovorans algicola]|uniref:tyrosine-type recombinase/integrase n=1 Tax=Polycyclovorans algicola TaxID=616992 RepID=UPI0004A74B74|nr:site-specific integrase [Polycyclovorans algicola]